MRDIDLCISRAGNPRFFVLSCFCAREWEAKKALEHEVKSVKKAKAPSVKAIKREFALFCLQGGGTFVGVYVCMYVFKDVHMYVGMYVCK
jgi:hypothetical protein